MVKDAKRCDKRGKARCQGTVASTGMAVLSPLPPQQRCAEVLTANPKMLCLPADPSHGEQSGTEEVIDGSGYLHEDGRLPLHCHLLRGTFPRGMDPSDRPRCSWETGTFPRL